MPKEGGRKKGRPRNSATAKSKTQAQDISLAKNGPSSIYAAGITSKQYGSKANEASTAAAGSAQTQQVKPPHKIRKPRPPPFAELFLKDKKDNNKIDSLESSGFFKEISDQRQGFVAGRSPLAPLLAASLHSNASSLCAPDDTFDKIWSNRCGPSTIQHRSAGISGVEDSCSTSDTASLDMPGPLYASLDSQGPCSSNLSSDHSGPWCIPPSPPGRRLVHKKFSKQLFTFAPKCNPRKKEESYSQEDNRLLLQSSRQKDSVIESPNDQLKNSVSAAIDNGTISQDSLLDLDAKKLSNTHISEGPFGNKFKTPMLLSHRTRNRSKCLGKRSVKTCRPTQGPCTPRLLRPATLTNACLSGKLATVRTRRRLAVFNRSRHRQDQLLVQFSMSGDSCRVLSVSQGNCKRRDLSNDDHDARPDPGQEGIITQRFNRVSPASASGSDTFKFPSLPGSKPQCPGVPLDHMLLIRSSESFRIVSKCSGPRDRLTSTPSQRPKGNLRQLLPSSSTPAATTDGAVPHLDRLSPVRSDGHSSQCIRMRSSSLFESPLLEQQDDVFKGNQLSCGEESRSQDDVNQDAGSECKNRLRFSQASSGDPSSSYTTATSTKWKSQNQTESLPRDKPNNMMGEIPSLLSSSIIEQLSRPCSVVLTDCISTSCGPRLSDFKSPAVNINTNTSEVNVPSVHGGPCEMSITIKTTISNKHTSSEVRAFIHPWSSAVAKSPDCEALPGMSGPTTSMLQSSFFKEAMRCGFAPSPVITRRHEKKRTSRLVSDMDASWNLQEAFNCKRRRRRDIRSIMKVDERPLTELSSAADPVAVYCTETGPAACLSAMAESAKDQGVEAELDTAMNAVGEPVRARSVMPGPRPKSPLLSSRRSRRITRPSYSAARRMLTRSQLRRQSSNLNASTTKGSVSYDSDAENLTSVMSIDKTKRDDDGLRDADGSNILDLESSVKVLSSHYKTADAFVSVEDCIKKTAGLALDVSVSGELPSIMELSALSDCDERTKIGVEEESTDGHKSSNNVSSVTIGVDNKLKKLSLDAVSGEVRHNASVHCCDEEDLSEAADLFAMPTIIELPTKRGKGWRRSLSSFGVSTANYSRTSLASFRCIVPADCDRRQTAPGAVSFKLGAAALTTHNDCSRNSSLSWQRRSSILQRSVVMTTHPTREEQQLYARRQVLDLCGQDDVLPITRCFDDSNGCRKIGEGVYGEVFMVAAEGARPAKVLKVMPIEGAEEVNGEPQKTFAEILSEIIISVELSALRNGRDHRCSNFVHVLKCWCVRGAYTEHMLHCWDQFHEEKSSENDRPDLFGPDQLYIVLEFGHGGKDLESYVFNNAGQALSVFWQVAHGLSVAESSLEFEHRDLHWGNVLVAPSIDTSEQYLLQGQESAVALQGVRATIIDFTLSRLRCSSSVVVYNNLAADPSLFTATGDYQFDVYRAMKGANGNEWEKFEPRTNVLWLHYLVDKLISECYYKNIKTKVHKANICKLERLRDRVLQYDSARHLAAEEWKELS